MQTWPREPSEGIRRALIGMVVVLWVAAIVLAVVALTRPFPLPTSLWPASPHIGASAPPPTPGPSISSGNPALEAVLPRTGPASAGYPPGEPPGDVEDDTAPPPRSASAPANPTSPAAAPPTLPVPSSASVPSPATKPTLPIPTLPPLPVPSIGP
jgi:hypothetical protein